MAILLLLKKNVMTVTNLTGMVAQMFALLRQHSVVKASPQFVNHVEMVKSKETSFVMTSTVHQIANHVLTILTQIFKNVRLRQLC